jgi:alpha-L-rhamnosidase
MTNRLAGAAALAALMLISLGTAAARITPENLRVEYRVNPLGIDAARPRLSWTLASAERSQRQSAYRILVASRPELLDAGQGDLWDSGRVASSRQNQIEYAGAALASHRRCWWKTRVWDGAGTPGEWSAAAEWSMGVLKPEDWKGDWIAMRTSPAASGPLPLFRKQFAVSRPVRRAVVHSTGVGFYELHLNGKKVGDEVLSPLWTNYRRTVFYLTHDITDRIAQGPNVFAATLGNGFYNVVGGRYIKFIGSFGTPLLRVYARLEHDDGSVTEIGTDGSWKAAPGPTTFSCIHGGEDYDARLEHAGWMLPGFDDSKWRGAGFDGSPGGDLAAQFPAPVKVMRSLQTARITEPAPGVRIYDLGQNFAGWPRIRVRGCAGASVKMSPAELLKPDGRIDPTSATGGAGGISFSYTLKGEGIEQWHPLFSYTGFRYLEVETQGEVEILAIEGDFVHSSTPRAGRFTSSSPLFNRIDELVDNAVRSNFQSVLTDCPHREKLGWLEVAHLMGPSILYNYDAAGMYAKIARDAREAQLPNGLVPDIAPEYTVFRGGFRDSPEWGSTAAIVPWQLYKWFGDLGVLRESYPAMVRYAGYLASLARGHIVSQGLGDWYDIGPRPPGQSQLTPKGITATAVYYEDVRILAEAAALLGKPADAARWAAMGAEVRRAFHTTFFKPGERYYGTGSQTAQAMPLVYGMVPVERRAAVVEQLVRDVRSRGDQQTAGDIGYRYLIRALTDAGRSDVLWAMNTRTNVPSYGAQIAQGVTSLAEAWDANPHSSQNHCMLGHVQEWFITGLAGIGQAPDSVGFERIVIRPQVVGDLAGAGAYYDSIRGRIESRWTREQDKFTLEVRIPPNATATVYVPARGGVQTHAIGSGTYRFTSVLPGEKSK